MTIMDMLLIPGMDSGTKKLRRMRMESQSKLKAAARQQQLANALMSERSRKARQNQR